MADHFLQFRKDLKKLARHLAIEQSQYPKDGPPIQETMDRPEDTSPPDTPKHG